MTDTAVACASNISVKKADYRNPQHQRDIVSMLDDYARGPMGGGKPLTDYSREHVVDGLAEISGAVTFLAYSGDAPVAIVNALPGFSSFAAKPLLNIHDLAVVAEYRGKGISQQLLASVEAVARDRGYCKVTLEVLDGNSAAKNAYFKFGFSGYELDPTAGSAIFLEKKLP